MASIPMASTYTSPVYRTPIYITLPAIPKMNSSTQTGSRHWLVIASLLLALLIGGTPQNTFAQDEAEAAAKEAAPKEGEEEEDADTEDGAMNMPNTGSIYIPFKPPFVVNYGGAGRLKFMKADIAVRLNDAKAANSVRHHMPYIRNNLVMLFSAQTDESIGSQDGKEALRKEALEEVRAVIQKEDRQEGVIDLYFNTILVQK